MQVHRTSLLTLLCALTLSEGAAAAQHRPPRSDAEPGAHRGHKPPEEAYTACEELSEDDACQLELRDRTIEGNCVADRDDGTLFCMPERPPMPPQATQACSDKAVGDACSVTGPDGREMPEGVCVEGRSGEALHCRPPLPPSHRS